MSNKNILVLIAVLALLGGAVFAQQKLSKFGQNPSGYLAGMTIGKAAVNKITITDAGKTFDYPVASASGLLDALYPDTDPVLVSQTDAKHKNFQLESASPAAKIVLNNTLEILLGKENYPGRFVRFPSSPAVYLLNPLPLPNNPLSN
jgi:hypothetical protein